MDLRKISKWSLIIGTLLIWAIKFIIRPFIAADEPMRLFLGIAPNFFGSFLIPFGVYWLFKGRFAGHLRAVCYSGFALLVINEYLQLIPVFGRTFDYMDILFSAVGLTLSYFVFGKLYNKSTAVV